MIQSYISLGGSYILTHWHTVYAVSISVINATMEIAQWRYEVVLRTVAGPVVAHVAADEKDLIIEQLHGFIAHDPWFINPSKVVLVRFEVVADDTTRMSITFPNHTLVLDTDPATATSILTQLNPEIHA